MREAFALQKLLKFFQQKILAYFRYKHLKFTNEIVSFEQPCLDLSLWIWKQKALGLNYFIHN